MDRARLAVPAAVSVVLSVASAVFAAGGVAPSELGAVAWPVSTLLVSEVQTGGASASDEFAEITNAGATAVDLSGLELAYATSTGTTVTRKASWSTSLLLAPGRHLLVANTAGIYASLADVTYSGGFAATGGAIVLRVIGGATIDALGWGDATNAFVEGAPMAAPPAGSSIERRPGGLAGNTQDTNSNAVDWFDQGAPNPQSLAAPPVPAPGATVVPTPSMTATAVPTLTASPTLTPTTAPTTLPSDTPAPTSTESSTPTPGTTGTPEPTASPAPDPTDSPTPPATPSLEPSPEPTVAPSAEPTVAPTVAPTPTTEATPMATPSPTSTAPTVLSVAAARALPDDASATVVGVLTTQLGALESGRKAFLQDDTAGIALYLDVAVTDGLPAGTLVMVSGTLDDRFAERTLRAPIAGVVALGEQSLPTAALATTGAVGESDEGTRILVRGTTVGAPSALSDGLGLMVDDGTGQVRVIVGSKALGGATLPGGTNIVAVGPVGQRDSSGTGLAGYRVHATEAGELQIVPPPTPSPSPTAAPTGAPTSMPTAAPSGAPTSVPTAAPTAAPTTLPSQSAATPSPRPSPSPTPTATPGPTPPPVIDIIEARGAAVGTIVTVTGVVTAEAGRLGIPPVIAIADGTGGIAVRLPDDVPHPARGTTVLVKGPLADPYGQLELRPTATGFSVLGRGSLPAPLELPAAQMGEATEGRLAVITGTVTATPRKGTSGDLTIDLVDPTGTAFRVVADGSSGISPADLVKDHAYRLTGIVGQRASRKGALDGYRLYPRDRADIAATSAAGPGASGEPGGASAIVVPVSTALAVPDGTKLTIEATVTAGATLLDSSGRRIVVQDRTGAIEVLLPTGSAAPAVGSTIRVAGTTGRAWGAPRIAATEITKLQAAAPVSPVVLHRVPAERDEWQLVRLTGTVAKVSRIGEKWHAELTLPDGSAALIQGQAGAGIPSTAIVTGRRLTVTGIVRRPYPTASDRRFAVLPRDSGDLALGSAGSGDGVGDGGGPGSGTGAGSAGATGGQDAAAAITPDTDLATLAEAVGRKVKVGGLIAHVARTGFDLDDGTALARVELRGDVLALLPHLRDGEAIAATGVVEIVDGAPAVVVDDDGTLVRVGTLGEGLPIAASPVPQASDEAGSGGAPLAADSSGIFGGPAPVSVFALASLTALSVAATVIRRRLQRRRLRLAIVARLGALAPARGGVAGVATSDSSSGHVPPEHESA